MLPIEMAFSWPQVGVAGKRLQPHTASRNPRAHRAASDVATLLELLSYRQRNRRPYLDDLLRNAGIILPRRKKA
jgi:hypothetical protein